MSKETTTRSRKGWKIAFMFANVAIIAGLAVFGGMYFKKYNDLKNNPISSEEAAKKEEDQVVDKISKLYAVPKDERPIISTVKDKELLKKQYPDFFSTIENEDKVIFYQNAGIAIAYRPSTNQLVKVGPLKIQSSVPSAKIIGPQANRDAVEQTIKTAYKDKLTVADKADAKAGYVGVTVVDLGGKNTDLVKQIAASLKGQVGTLPAGEDKPDNAEILIIAGTTTP